MHRDLKWPNVLEMFYKFFHGLLQCRNRDINIAANHAFARDFSHRGGPRQRVTSRLDFRCHWKVVLKSLVRFTSEEDRDMLD